MTLNVSVIKSPSGVSLPEPQKLSVKAERLLAGAMVIAGFSMTQTAIYRLSIVHCLLKAEVTI